MTTLRPFRTYASRLAVWAIALAQVRGLLLSDQVRILISALCAPFTAARRLDRWLDPQLLFDAHVRVPSAGLFHLRKRTDDLWHVVPWRERSLVELVSGLQPGQTFVDAGANIGFYSVMASRRIGRTGRVVAIEMMPDTAAILRAHLALNGAESTTVVQRALSDAAGRQVTAAVPAGSFGKATINPREDCRGWKEVPVSTTTLDEVLRDVPHVDLLKMDLEGGELAALQGASETLARCDAIVCEQLEEGSSLQDLLKTAGFAIRQLDRRNFVASRRREV